LGKGEILVEDVEKKRMKLCPETEIERSLMPNMS
jgi:hypothetical protein